MLVVEVRVVLAHRKQGLGSVVLCERRRDGYECRVVVVTDMAGRRRRRNCRVLWQGGWEAEALGLRLRTG